MSAQTSTTAEPAGWPTLTWGHVLESTHPNKTRQIIPHGERRSSLIAVLDHYYTVLCAVLTYYGCTAIHRGCVWVVVGAGWWGVHWSVGDF